MAIVTIVNNSIGLLTGTDEQQVRQLCRALLIHNQALEQSLRAERNRRNQDEQAPDPKRIAENADPVLDAGRNLTWCVPADGAPPFVFPGERRELLNTKPAKIVIRTRNRIVFINMSDLEVIETRGHYVALRTASRSHLLRESISMLEEKLKPYGFVRVHRSTIVNRELVEEIGVSSTGEMSLRLTRGQKEYRVSRKYRDGLKSIAPQWE